MKLKYDEPLSECGFRLNLRRYTEEYLRELRRTGSSEAAPVAGTIGLGRVVQIEPMKSMLKAPGMKRFETEM